MAQFRRCASAAALAAAVVNLSSGGATAQTTVLECHQWNHPENIPYKLLINKAHTVQLIGDDPRITSQRSDDTTIELTLRWKDGARGRMSIYADGSWEIGIGNIAAQNHGTCTRKESVF